MVFIITFRLFFSFAVFIVIFLLFFSSSLSSILILFLSSFLHFQYYIALVLSCPHSFIVFTYFLFFFFIVFIIISLLYFASTMIFLVPRLPSKFHIFRPSSLFTHILHPLQFSLQPSRFNIIFLQSFAHLYKFLHTLIISFLTFFTLLIFLVSFTLYIFLVSFAAPCNFLPSVASRCSLGPRVFVAAGPSWLMVT